MCCRIRRSGIVRRRIRVLLSAPSAFRAAHPIPESRENLYWWSLKFWNFSSLRVNWRNSTHLSHSDRPQITICLSLPLVSSIFFFQFLFPIVICYFFYSLNYFVLSIVSKDPSHLVFLWSQYFLPQVSVRQLPLTCM